jgi:hypothetical protein
MSWSIAISHSSRALLLPDDELPAASDEDDKAGGVKGSAAAIFTL